MGDYYVLDGRVPVESSPREWAVLMETADRTVAKSTVGEVEVSTVFLGLDHSFGDGPPLLFETMVFGGPLDQEMYRYSRWEEAETGHAAMVKRVMEATPDE